MPADLDLTTKINALGKILVQTERYIFEIDQFDPEKPSTSSGAKITNTILESFFTKDLASIEGLNNQQVLSAFLDQMTLKPDLIDLDELRSREMLIFVLNQTRLDLLSILEGLRQTQKQEATQQSAQAQEDADQGAEDVDETSAPLTQAEFEKKVRQQQSSSVARAKKIFLQELSKRGTNLSPVDQIAISQIADIASMLDGGKLSPETIRSLLTGPAGQSLRDLLSRNKEFANLFYAYLDSSANTRLYYRRLIDPHNRALTFHSENPEGQKQIAHALNNAMSAAKGDSQVVVDAFYTTKKSQPQDNTAVKTNRPKSLDEKREELIVFVRQQILIDFYEENKNNLKQENGESYENSDEFVASMEDGGVSVADLLGFDEDKTSNSDLQALLLASELSDKSARQKNAKPGMGRFFKKPPNKSDQTKAVVKSAKTATQALRNTAFLGIGLGGAAAGLTLYSLLTQGVVGVSTLAGTIVGAVGGTLIGLAVPFVGPILGVGLGAIGGALSGNALGWALTGGAGAGGGVGVAQMTAAAGKATASLLPSSTAVTAAAGKGLTGIAQVISAIQSAGNAFTGLLGSGGTVVAAVSIGAVTTVYVVASAAGAFLASDQASVDESKYLEVQKTATPARAATPQSVTYTLSIRPKLDEQGSPYVITVNDAQDSYRLSSKQTGLTPPNAPDLSAFSGVLPTSGKTITYTVDFAAMENYQDTRITNTLKVGFSVGGQDPAIDQTASKYATVTFGNPPSDLACLEFGPKDFVYDPTSIHTVTTSEWTEEEKERIIEAFSVVTNYPKYIDLLCGPANEKITLYRYGGGANLGGWASSTYKASKIVIYDEGIRHSVLSTRYTLIHELGHTIFHRQPQLYQSYLSQVDGKETYLPSYPLEKSSAEDFPETLSVYILNNSYSLINIDLASEYPKHYRFAKQEVFELDPPEGQ